jgi:DNA-binding CsgD family transcriptional regulator/tetratricopeptide (TPR) repeat protein
VDGLFRAVTEHGGALIVRGDVGTGKSALLRAGARRAAERGMLVLTAAGVPSEAHLPFAGLHQLLRPVLGAADHLPRPQGDALAAAFGLNHGGASDLFTTALAVLDLLAEVSERAPVLVVAEDAHWLDSSTADVLAFVARRLHSEAVVLLAELRDGVESPLDRAGLPELRLEPLDAQQAGALLDRRAAGLAAPVRERLLATAAGNPLALVELPVAWASGGDDERPPMPSWLPLTTRLEQAFAARVSDLPIATRRLLLVAAVDDAGVLAEVLSAASTLADAELTVEDLAPAVSARLVSISGTDLRFRHPLVRTAICQAASTAQRHAAHAALAGVLGGQPDRRAWHRAASSVGPDEEVAGELDAAAASAQRRGAISVAQAALERAAQLSEDPRRRSERLLDAADMAFELGLHDAVGRLLQEADPLQLDPLQNTRLAWRREMIQGGLWSGASRIGAFVEIAERLRRDGATDLALDALLTVALRCWWSNPDQETRELLVAAAERIDVPPDSPQMLAILGLAAPVERGGVVVERMARLRPGAVTDPLEALQLGRAATAVGTFDRAAAYLETAVEALRGQGRLGLLAQALVHQAWGAAHIGNWRLAVAAAEEAERLAGETSQPRWVAAGRLAGATVAGMRGDDERAESLAAAAEEVLLPMGANPMLSLVALARGAAALGDGRHDDAHDHLRRIFDPSDVAFHPFVRGWAIADLVEAAVHTGHEDEARAALQDLEPLAGATRDALVNAGVRCARALLAGDREADALFRAGLGEELRSWPFLRARLLLAHGTWLRRRRRVARSRAPLREAREAFDALGAIPWAERARQELRASGETSRRREPDRRDELTPQELQIAQMAADGLTNREIGRRLYLSHRTVSTHLYRMFPKLGVTARSELRSALEGARPGEG